MRLVQFALSACLVVGSMAGVSSAAFASGSGYGNGHSGGHHAGRHQSRGHHGGGHRSRGHHGRGHSGGHSSRRHGNGGAFIAGTVVGALLGWNSGYGYTHAQQHRFGRHHRPYYAPRHSRGGHHGHARRYYSYSDGHHGGGRAYQTRGGNAGCHPVNKVGHWNGRHAKIGGTMCYNSYGTGYVVSGSRYLIHYR